MAVRPPDRVSMPDNRNYSNAVAPRSSSNSTPMIGAAISAGSSLLGSLFSSISANKQLKAQQEENQLNRDFNSQEAQKNRDFQRQMFDAENAYNDPKAAVARLQAAGLNPALAYGNFANSAGAMSGSAASSSGSVNPAMPDWSGIGSAGRAFLDGELIKAQTRNVNAQAAKVEAETNYVDTLLSLDADLKRVGIDVGISTKGMQNENAKVLSQTFENLKSEFNNIEKNGKLIDELVEQAKSDKLIKQSAARFADAQQYASLRESLSRSQVNEFQFLRGVILVQAELKSLLAKARLDNSQASLNDFENAINKGFSEAGISTANIAKLRRDLLSSQVDSNNASTDLTIEESKFTRDQKGWQSTTGVVRSLGLILRDIFE